MKFEIIKIWIYVFGVFLIKSKICFSGSSAVVNNGDFKQEEKSTSKRDFYQAQDLIPAKGFSVFIPFYGHGYSVKSNNLPVKTKINENTNQDILVGEKLGSSLPWKHEVLSLAENLKFKNLFQFVRSDTGANEIKTRKLVSKQEIRRRLKREAGLDKSGNETVNTTSLIDSGNSNHITNGTSIQNTTMVTDATTNQMTVSHTSKYVGNSSSDQVYDTEGSGVINEDNITSAVQDGNSTIKNNSLHNKDLQTVNISSKGDNSVSNKTAASSNIVPSTLTPLDTISMDNVTASAQPFPTTDTSVNEPVSEPEPTVHNTSLLRSQSEPSSTPEPENKHNVSTNKQLPNLESSTNSKAISEPEPHSTPEPDFYTSIKPISEPQPNSTSEPETTSESTPKPETISNSSSKPEPKPTLEPEPTAESISEPETTMKSTPEPESSPQPEPTSISASEPTTETKTEPEPTVMSTPHPEPTSESTPEPEATTESTPEPEKTAETTQSEPEPTSTTEPESKPTTDPEPKSTTEPESTPTTEPEPSSTSEPKPSSTTEPEPSSTTEPEPSSTTEPEPKSSSEPEPTAESTPEPEKTSISTFEPEPKATSEPETSSEPTSEPETSSEPTSEPETSSESTLEPETSSEPTSEPETSSEPTSEPETSSEPTSEPETSSEPTSEPELSSGPNSEPETTSEPESEPEPESENAFAEPNPVWHLAKEEWRWGWEFLIYFFGVMFILLGLFSFISVIRLWRMNHLLSKNYFLTLNILIIVKCALRGSYLLVDGYNTNNTFHDILNYFLYSTAFPCLTSAFSILFYALLLATKMQVISTRIQKLPILIGIIVFHFALSLITDVVVGLFSDARILMLVCQFFYIIWGLVLFIAYFYIFRKLYYSAMKRQKALARQMSSNNSNEKPKKTLRSRYTLSLSVKVTFIAALFGLGCIALELYGIFGVYKVYVPGHRPEPWPWWIYQFSLRTLEFLMCLTMVYVASQPIKYQKRKGDGVCSLYFLPFKRICCCCCCCRDDSVSDGDFTWASSNAIALPSSHSDNYKLPKNKKNSKKSKQGIYALEKNGSAKPVKLTHIVIEDGKVRFKSEEDVTDNSSELGTSLPDLVNGNVVKDDIYETDTIQKVNIKQANGVYNVGFNETEGVNYKNEKLSKMTNNQVNNNSENRIHKSSMDHDGSSIGTFGTDVGRNLSSLNLADSMEFEFEKVYERSFVQDETNSIKSLPNILCVNNTDDSINSNLLSNMSPDHSCTEFNHDQVSFSSSGPNDSSVSGGPNSPTRKPLIQGTGRRSSYELLNSFQAQTKL